MHRIGDRAAVEAAFASAAHVVELALSNRRLYAAPLEPRAVLAMPDAKTGRMTLHTATQNPTAVHEALTRHVFQWPDERLRIRVPDIGGCFGMKGYLCPEDVLALWLAERLRQAARAGTCHVHRVDGRPRLHRDRRDRHPRRRQDRGRIRYAADGTGAGDLVRAETGSTTIERFTCVDDIGVVVNPMIVEGQIQGGVAQGIGQALME